MGALHRPRLDRQIYGSPGPASPRAEGWGFFQAIHPAVAVASSDAAATVEPVYTRPASQAVLAGEAQRAYNALNSPQVLTSLAIPNSLVIQSPVV
jgi:hypothetical protein